MARKLSADERARIAEQLMQLGTYVLITLTVTQLVTDSTHLLVAAIGVVIFLLAWFLAYQIMKRG